MPINLEQTAEFPPKNIDTLMQNLAERPDLIVGLPYCNALALGEQLLPPESPAEKNRNKSYPEIRLRANEALDVFNVSPDQFNQLNRQFEEWFQQKEAAAEPPPHIKQNIQWLEDWNRQSQSIKDASVKRM